MDTVDGTPNANDVNDHDCFVVNDGSGWDWYNKYLLMKVTQKDLTNVSQPDVVTNYTYGGVAIPGGVAGGTAAWHHDDDMLAPGSTQSWAQWRGYTQVKAVTGTGGANSETGKQTTTTTTYYRGMDGDKTAAGTPRTVNLQDSQTTTADSNALAGQVREVQNFDGATAPNDTPTTYGSTELSGTLTTYGFSAVTVNGSTGNSFQPHNAVMIRPTSTVTRTTRFSGGTPTFKWRTHTVNDAYYPAGPTNALLPTGGLLQYEHDTGDPITGAGDVCKAYTYSTNPGAKWLIDFPQWVESRTGGCTGTTVGGTSYLYDGVAAGAVNNGNPTAVSVYRTASTGTGLNRTNYSYDTFGRVTGKRSPQGVADGGGRA